MTLFIKKVRRLLRNNIPWFIFNPIVNIARLIKLLWSPTYNIAELSRLHQTWLKSQFSFENLEKMINENPLTGDKLSQKEEFRLSERQIFSQGGEDGILLYIFRKIGITNKFFVEFGAGGKTSVALNLVINHGWSGLMMDGNQRDLDLMKNFVESSSSTNKANITYKKAWITKNNINELIGEVKKGEIDFLSIDIDGNDYYVWESINVVSPRVVLIEYNASFGQTSLTVGYRDDFDTNKFHKLCWYHGASLSALNKLSLKKGYSLVACDSKGINAFFVRTDCLKNEFKQQTPAETFYNHDLRTKLATPEIQFDQIKSFPLVEI